VVAEYSGEAFAQRRKRKPQVRAALVAARCVDSDQRIAGRTYFRPWLLVAAAEKSAHGILPFFHPPLPPIGKRQFSSLRPAHRVPIIPKSSRFFPLRRFFGGSLALMDKFEEFGKRIDEEFARIKSIKNFEDFGKRVDEELERVKSFVKEEVAPETEKRTAQFLREVSEKLTEAATWIEARNAARNSQNPPS
jgi:hypothetical protein